MIAVDLLTWPEYREERDAFEAELDRAAADIQSANAKYDEALRRFRCAPHGEQRSRQCDLRRANERILAAELKFAEIKRQEPVWD